jgi:hypothetical protein
MFHISLDTLTDSAYKELIATATARLVNGQDKSSLLLISDLLRSQCKMIDAKLLKTTSDIDIPEGAVLKEGVLPSDREMLLLDTDTYPCVVLEEKVTWIIFNTTFVEYMDTEMKTKFLVDVPDEASFWEKVKLTAVSYSPLRVQNSTINFDPKKLTQTTLVHGKSVTLALKTWQTSKRSCSNR